MQKQIIEQPDERLERAGQIAAVIESLLFVSGRPLTRAELRKLLDIDEERLGEGLRALEQGLEQGQRGVRVQYLSEQVQLVTAPEYARYVAALLGLPMTAKLTTAALETLSVIAYRQPVTRSQIEAVRGVNSDRALTSLIQHGLVEEIGRAQTVGRPSLFATTAEFLQQFGLTSMEQLPSPLGRGMGLPRPLPGNEETLPESAEARAGQAHAPTAISLKDGDPAQQSATQQPEAHG